MAQGRQGQQAERRAPGWMWLSGLAALILTALAAYGARGVHVDADVVGALAGDSPGYLAYRDFQDRFALGRADEALLVSAPDLAEADTFAAFEDLILDLQFTEGVAEVVSLFSLPGAETTTPLILADPQAPLADRFAALQASGPVAGALVTADRSAALLHVIATPETAPGALFAAMAPLLEAGGPLDVRTVGQAAVERQISHALVRDQVVVTPLAIAICILAGALVLRALRAVLVCAVPAICGVLWFLGLLGWSGRALDPWLATLPSLVLVMAFADTMHLFYAARAQDGLRGALREVLPAAFLTSLTSALALASFAIAGTEALTGLAIWGPVAMLCGFAAVALLFPLLSRLLVDDATARPMRFARALAPARAGLRRPRAMALVAVLTALVLLPAVNRAPASFSLSEHIRAGSPLGQTLSFMEAEGLGSASLFVEIADADGTPGLGPEDGARIAAVAAVAMSGAGNRLDAEAPQVPERFRAGDGLSVALPVLLPLGIGPDRFAGELARLEAGLEAAGLSDVTRLAGQTLLGHQVVPETVAAMRLSFYAALAAIALVVAISQRDLVLAALATAISALPMLAIEAVLVLTGTGMTMAVAFALTVAFGIAVDDTIHFINRWKRSGGDRDARLATALEQAGPPMIASTLIVTLGLAATMFSAIASLPQFGAFIIVALWMALIADLLLLPSLVRLVKR